MRTAKVCRSRVGKRHDDDHPNHQATMLTPEDMFPQLIQNRWQLSLVISGGGTGAIKTCLARSGASRSFVEAVVPYSRKSMIDYLGHPLVGPSASVETVRQLAIRACQRAGTRIDVPDARPVGLALTCALPTEPPRDQIHQVHVAICGQGFSRDWSNVLSPDLTSRAEAESIAESMLLDALRWLALRET